MLQPHTAIPIGKTRLCNQSNVGIHEAKQLCCKSAWKLYSGYYNFFMHELCMTNPHALLKWLAFLAAWIGWQEADQLLVKVPQSDMLSVEQHQDHMWRQKTQQCHKISCCCIVLAVQTRGRFSVDHALTFCPCCSLTTCIVTCLAISYKDHAYQDHGSATSMSLSSLIYHLRIATATALCKSVGMRISNAGPISGSSPEKLPIKKRLVLRSP